MITLKVGKRYVRRDGKISGKLFNTGITGDPYPMWDGECSYSKDGKSFRYGDMVSGIDLIREYKPEWCVVIKCVNREDARMLKWTLNQTLPSNKITVEKSS